MVSISDKIPKANGMLREGIWLHPGHRILYLSCLKWLIGKIDQHIPHTVYSYRRDTQLDDITSYPFKRKIARWKSFSNDFRRSALEDSINYVLITDLAAYYDHINIDTMLDRIKLLLHGTKNICDDNIIELLGNLMRIWSRDNYGIPQNYDPSSFFGSLYLHTVDSNILSKRYVYFRYVDDMRFCCQNERQAYRALHDLQEELQKDRLYLNGSKTKILKKGSPEFTRLIDVEDDVIISDCEQKIRNGLKEDIVKIIPIIRDKIIFNAREEGDDRKLRAYINRALDLMDYDEFKGSFDKEIKELIMARITTNPARTDYWVKFLSSVVDDTVVAKVFDLLFRDKVIFNWQRYNLIRLLISSKVDISSVMQRREEVRSAYVNSPSELEKGLLIILIGKMTSAASKPDLYSNFFTQQLGYYQQRCLLIALYDLDHEVRNKIYDRALNINHEHSELVSYLKSKDDITIGIKPRYSKKLPEQPKKIVAITKSGVGLVKGKIAKYRMSYDACDYE